MTFPQRFITFDGRQMVGDGRMVNRVVPQPGAAELRDAVAAMNAVADNYRAVIVAVESAVEAMRAQTAAVEKLTAVVARNVKETRRGRRESL